LLVSRIPCSEDDCVGPLGAVEDESCAPQNSLSHFPWQNKQLIAYNSSSLASINEGSSPLGPIGIRPNWGSPILGHGNIVIKGINALSMLE
ncbi:hypothetical protein Ancab_038168, partial [Ancistrocladus abbreviatus]